MLAARSPTFAALFIQKEKEQNHAMECRTVDEIEQFIKFMYTGEVEKPVNDGDLTRLAVKYQVKTLENLEWAARYHW